MDKSLSQADHDAAFSPEESQELKNAAKHPTVEQLLFRTAVEKALTTKEQEIWAKWNYDRQSHEEIAEALNIGRSAVSHQISRIESKLTTWCQDHMAVYAALVAAQKNGDIYESRED